MKRILMIGVLLLAGCGKVPSLQVHSVINQSEKKFAVGDTVSLVIVYEALSPLGGEPSYTVTADGAVLLKGKSSRLRFYDDPKCLSWQGNTDSQLDAGEYACTQTTQPSASFPDNAPIEIRILEPSFSITVAHPERTDTFSFSADGTASSNTTDSTNKSSYAFALDELLFADGDCPKASPSPGCYSFHFLLKATSDSIPADAKVTYQITNQQNISLLTGGLDGLVKGSTGYEGMSSCEADSPATVIGGSVKGCNVASSSNVNDAKTAQYSGAASASSPPGFDLRISVDGKTVSTIPVTLPVD